METFKRNDIVFIKSLCWIDMIQSALDNDRYTLRNYSGEYYADDLTKVYDTFDNRLTALIYNKSSIMNPEDKKEYTLGEFIKNFIKPNSLIRLWRKKDNGHSLIIGRTDGKLTDVCMEWEIIKGTVWQSMHIDNTVFYIADISTNDLYREAINIVIDAKENLSY